MGRMVWPDHISRAWRSLNRRPPAKRPESSRQISHFERSVTLEAIPPAGETFSTESTGTICSCPPSTEWGVAALAPEMKYSVVVPVSFMPRGARMRWRTTSSHVAPPAAATTSPATT